MKILFSNLIVGVLLASSAVAQTQRTVQKTMRLTTVSTIPVIEITDRSGKVIKTFTSVDDFTEEDRIKYPEVFRAFQNIKKTEAEVLTLNSFQTEALGLLQKFDANGFYIYSNLLAKSVFTTYLGDGKPIFAGEPSDPAEYLDSAVHESLHKLDSEVSKYPKHMFHLMSGQIFSVPARGPFKVGTVVNYLTPVSHDGYAKNYLLGSIADQGVAYLLDEINAYAQGGNTKLLIAEKLNLTSQFNPGLQHMMFYLELYLRHARVRNLAAWNVMHSAPGGSDAILALWRQAEEVLNRACASKNAPTERKYLGFVYSAKNIAEMETLFDGRQLFQTPSACVN